MVWREGGCFQHLYLGLGILYQTFYGLEGGTVKLMACPFSFHAVFPTPSFSNMKSREMAAMMFTDQHGSRRWTTTETVAPRSTAARKYHSLPVLSTMTPCTHTKNNKEAADTKILLIVQTPPNPVPNKLHNENKAALYGTKNLTKEVGSTSTFSSQPHHPPSQPHFSYPACCVIWHVLETNGLRTTNWWCTVVINKLVEGIEFDHPKEVLSCPIPQNLEVLHRILEPVSTDRERHGA